MGVDAEGKSRIGVAEVVGESPDARTGVELDAGVEVAEGMRAVLAGGLDIRRPERRLPDVAVVEVAVGQLALSGGEQE
ncbi:MAG: hypothetical protein ACRDRT_03985, partial [Pseudonocardiaceae bacterium]